MSKGRLKVSSNEAMLNRYIHYITLQCLLVARESLIDSIPLYHCINSGVATFKL